MASTLTRRELLNWWRQPLARIAEKTTAVRPPVPAREALPEFLRPPGAAPEPTFLDRCDRCGDCREACPYDVILPLGPAYGDAEGTPALLPRGGPCRLCADVPCARACPTGALKEVPPEAARMGVARIDPQRCWAHQGQPCDYCVTECPLGEAVLRMLDGHPEIIEDRCAGCGMCLYICTATPPAIQIRPASCAGMDASVPSPPASV
jgi:MauM/NapG family ferredoxin protein